MCHKKIILIQEGMPGIGTVKTKILNIMYIFFMTDR